MVSISRRFVYSHIITVPIQLRPECGSSFSPRPELKLISRLKPNWSAFYAPGPEILEYLKNTTEKYKLRPYIKLRHELKAARYDEETGKWHLTIKRPAEKDGEFEEFEDVADLFFTGVGVLSRLRWPSIDGLQNFKGIKVHTGDWNLGGKTWQDDVKDWGDKKIGVIGLVGDAPVRTRVLS